MSDLMDFLQRNAANKGVMATLRYAGDTPVFISSTEYCADSSAKSLCLFSR